MRVSRPDPEVAVESDGPLAAEWQGSLSSGLAHPAGHVVLEVEVVHAEANQLGRRSRSKERVKSGSLGSDMVACSRQSGGAEALC